MDLSKLQTTLQMRYKNDASRVARIAHFIGLLKTGVEGMATMGVILNVTSDDIELRGAIEPVSDVLGSIDAAIAHVQGGSHATNSQGPEDQIRNG